MEDHDGAYWSWKEAGLSGRVLFHFDAHIDFAWIIPSADALLDEKSLPELLRKAAQSPLWSLAGKSREDRVDLGNYIHEAIQNGIVGEFVWVYPDHPEAARQAGAVGRILRSLSAVSPRDLRVDSEPSPGRFVGTICGRPFQALAFSDLARAAARKDVLLDVDVDFFIVQSLFAPAYPLAEPARASWWLSPEDFLDRVRAAGLSYDHATIAYSVEEGYTPATLKFLGDELAGRIAGTLTRTEARRFDVLRRVHDASKTANAVEKAAVLAAELEAGRAPSLLFNLAVASAETGDFARAKEFYKEAVAADPSYRSRYNHPGQSLLDMGRVDEARASFERMRRLDPEHPAYRLFGFQHSLWKGDRAAAVSAGTGLFAAGLREPELLLGLADCRLAQGDPRSASRWLSVCADAALSPQQRPRFWALKARAAQGQRCWADAMEANQNLLRLAPRVPTAHWSLAKLYARKGNWYKARRHAWKAFQQRER